MIALLPNAKRCFSWSLMVCGAMEKNRIFVEEGGKFKVWNHLGELVFCRGLEAKWCESVEEY